MSLTHSASLLTVALDSGSEPLQGIYVPPKVVAFSPFTDLCRLDYLVLRRPCLALGPSLNEEEIIPALGIPCLCLI